MLKLSASDFAGGCWELSTHFPKIFRRVQSISSLLQSYVYLFYIYSRIRTIYCLKTTFSHVFASWTMRFTYNPYAQRNPAEDTRLTDSHRGTRPCRLNAQLKYKAVCQYWSQKLCGPRVLIANNACIWQQLCSSDWRFTSVWGL